MTTMNRAQRRKNPGEAADVASQPAPFGPLYQVTLDVHLAKDGLWGREFAANNKRTIHGRAPDVIWQETMSAITQMLGLSTDRFLIGLLLNLINNLPGEARKVLLMGIVAGTGMTIKPGHGEMVVEVLDGTFPPIAIDSPGRTRSGLIIPDKKLVVSA